MSLHFKLEGSNVGTRHTVNATRVALCGGTLTPRDGSLPTLLQDPCVSRNIRRDARIGVLKLVVAYGWVPSIQSRNMTDPKTSHSEHYRRSPCSSSIICKYNICHKQAVDLSQKGILY